jgi:fatty acid desaturase
VRWLAFALHVARVVLWSAALAAVIELTTQYPPWIALAAVPAALVYFAAFSFFHDCAHGALGLPPRVNDVVLFLTSAPLFLSAHGQRQLHLRHHARPLADDDMEGEGALASLPVALVTSPTASFRMRVASFFAANARVRPWIVVENVLNGAVVVAAVWSENAGVQVAAATMLGLQLTMNAWASHVPHRAPRWLLALAARLAWTHSPVVLSLVYHLEHHAHPRVPCMDLRPNLDVIHSPLIEVAVVARPEPLPWVSLQVVTRPRPRTRA